MSQALYRKWRPQSWDAVIGQDHVVHTLRNSLATGRIMHAYLLAGPRGTGKTTTARLLAKAANCLVDDLAERPCGSCAHCQAVNEGHFLDMIEIDAASNTSVEDVRDLRDKINFSPNQGRYKVYIIDEVHMLSTAAFNALLKTLEEPPPHAIFVLATTEVHKIPATVLSRCQRHEFRRIPVADIVATLQKIAEGEDIKIEDRALTLIARQATGAMRDAISLLDQLASTGQAINLEMAQDVLGTAASQSVLALVEALINKQADAGLDQIHSALDAGSDPRQYARQIVDYLRDLLLIHLGNAEMVDASVETRAQMARHAQAFDTPELLRIIRVFNHAATEARSLWQPSLPLEIAFVEALGGTGGSTETSTPPKKPSKSSARQPAAPTVETAPPVPPPESQADETAAPVEAEPSEEDQSATRSLEASWKAILDMVRGQNPTTYAVLNSCKSRYMRGNDLVLNFASDVIKEKMEQPESLETVRNAVTQVFGRELGVKCYVDTAKRDAIPPGVDNDGMVAAALRDLGGELVDIQ
jgi:DNA polymerase-3 subunit gamma/tau